MILWFQDFKNVFSLLVMNAHMYNIYIYELKIAGCQTQALVAIARTPYLQSICFGLIFLSHLHMSFLDHIPIKIFMWEPYTVKKYLINKLWPFYIALKKIQDSTDF